MRMDWQGISIDGKALKKLDKDGVIASHRTASDWQFFYSIPLKRLVDCGVKGYESTESSATYRRPAVLIFTILAWLFAIGELNPPFFVLRRLYCINFNSIY